MIAEVTDLGRAGIPRRGALRRLAVIASLLLILAAGGAALFLVQGVDAQSRDVLNGYEVRRHARLLLLGLIEAENAERGYVLTGDQQYLAPYRDALGIIDARMKTLIALTENSPEQRARISGMTEEIEQKKSEMGATIALTANGQADAARALVEANAGRLMDSLRGVIDTFIAHEDELLLSRNTTFQSARQWLALTIIAALAAAAVLAYALFTRSEAQVTALARSRGLLASANEELEAHVRDRTAELEESRRHAERERQRVEALLQDTNHRIGNSLATVSSLLALQMLRTPSDAVKAALEAARSRVHAIASGHRRLRLGADLETTRADEFLDAVVEDFRATQASSGRIVFETQFEPIVIYARDATTIGIVLGELLTNALKHAFPDNRGGRIWATLFRNAAGQVTLGVTDDGAGMPMAGAALDGGLGSMIVKQLAQQFGGEPHYAAREGGGTAVTVSLPQLATPTPA